MVDNSNSSERPVIDIVVPAHREEASVGKVLERLARTGISRRIIIVCDRKDDPTFDVALKEGERLGLTVVPVVNPRPQRVAAAVLHGMRAAETAYVAVTMADGCDALDLLPRMLEIALAEQCAIVAVNRFGEGGGMVGAPVLKGTLSRAANRLLYWVWHFPLADATNNFRLYHRAFVLDHAPDDRCGWSLGLFLAARAVAAGKPVAELAGTWVERRHGRSRFRLWRWLPWYMAALGEAVCAAGRRRSWTA